MNAREKRIKKKKRESEREKTTHIELDPSEQFFAFKSNNDFVRMCGVGCGGGDGGVYGVLICELKECLQLIDHKRYIGIIIMDRGNGDT